MTVDCWYKDRKMEIITEDGAQRPALYRRGSDTNREYHTDVVKTLF